MERSMLTTVEAIQIVKERLEVYASHEQGVMSSSAFHRVDREDNMATRRANVQMRRELAMLS